MALRGLLYDLVPKTPGRKGARSRRRRGPLRAYVNWFQGGRIGQHARCRWGYTCRRAFRKRAEKEPRTASSSIQSLVFLPLPTPLFSSSWSFQSGGIRRRIACSVSCSNVVYVQIIVIEGSLFSNIRVHPCAPRSLSL